MPSQLPDQLRHLLLARVLAHARAHARIAHCPAEHLYEITRDHMRSHEITRDHHRIAHLHAEDLAEEGKCLGSV